MIEKENLKIGLEEVSDFFFEMYRKETDEYKAIKAKEYCDIAEDALALLKEQEAVEPTFKQDNDGIFVWACGSCGAYMYHIYEGIDKAKEYAKYCRQCGRKVKWE